MNRRRAVIRIILVSAVVLAALAVLIHQLRDREMFVYVAIAQELSLVPETDRAALLSSVSNCQADEARLQEAAGEAGRDLFRANGAGVTPRDLSRLKALIHVVPFQRAMHIHETGALPYQGISGFQSVYISRVGFSNAGDRAAVCVENEVWHGAFLLEHGDGPFWKVGDVRVVYVN